MERGPSRHALVLIIMGIILMVALIGAMMMRGPGANTPMPPTDDPVPVGQMTAAEEPAPATPSVPAPAPEAVTPVEGLGLSRMPSGGPWEATARRVGEGDVQLLLRSRTGGLSGTVLANPRVRSASARMQSLATPGGYGEISISPVRVVAVGESRAREVMIRSGAKPASARAVIMWDSGDTSLTVEVRGPASRATSVSAIAREIASATRWESPDGRRG